MKNIQDIDVKAARAQASQAQMEKAFEQAQAVNLDETNIEVVEVAFVEWKETKDEDGTSRRKPEVRIAHISTYVPMSILNSMLAMQQKVNRLKARIDAGEIEVEEDPHMDFINRQVLKVWLLSEPDMTSERFGRGLDFQKVYGLFSRFFGSQLRQLNNKA